MLSARDSPAMGLSLRLAPGAKGVQYSLPGPFGNLRIVSGQIGLRKSDSEVRFFGGLITRVAYPLRLAAFGGAQAFFLACFSVFEIINSVPSEQPISILH